MSTEILNWFKSSYSDGEGGECVEAAYTWHKASYRRTEGSECLEISLRPHTIHIRDSKNAAGPCLSLSLTAWSDFLASYRHPTGITSVSRTKACAGPGCPCSP